MLPGARFVVGHGQMTEGALEKIMLTFADGAADVLVCTTIIESGLDIPNANTIVIDRADTLGLAQLYQLRGRVGRSHRRAYCYLIVPDSIDADAEERLKVLEHHTDLGAGYRVALKDLELRGAGNMLGAEQSGQAHAVGFDLYLRWLEETVQALRGQGGRETQPPPEVVLDRPAHLPDSFVGDDDTKLDLYRRLARAETPDEIDGLRSELRERFGPLPVESETLLDMARLRVLGATLGIQHILIRGDEARVTFRAGVAPRMAKLSTALDDVQLVAEVRRTVPLALRLERLGGEALMPALVRALRAVV
jgi:transcription-repair coupling factor (superfamily II helicase)